MPAAVLCSRRDPKLPNISLQGPAAAVPAPIVLTAVTDAAAVSVAATTELMRRDNGRDMNQASGRGS